jgi:glycerate dehydrogenase
MTQISDTQNKRRIVVLCGHLVNPGDLSWQGLEEFGELTVYENSIREQVAERSRDAEIALTMATGIFDAAAIEALPRLRYIGVTATGYNCVDTKAARAKGIVVANVPAYSTPSTAQGAIALLLELTNQVGYYNQTVHEGRWCKSEYLCYWDRPLIELSGLTMGLVGFGDIGKAVASLARAFGMKILVYTRTRPAEAQSQGIEFCPLDDLFSRSDVISLHCPLTPDTRGLVNAQRLSLMKPTAFLINTARGAVIDEAALAEALNTGRIAGAGLDVLAVEPPREDNPLLKAKNCVITPHNGWMTLATRRRLIECCIDNVRAFLAGRPVNVVN